MTDLTEDTLAPDVVIRRSPAAEVDIRPGADGSPPVVGVTQGAVWARAEPSSPGVDLGHGSLNVVVRAGTVLLDAQAGSGLVIVLRGTVEISGGGELVRTARAGEALAFDGSGTVGDPDPVDAAELAHDPFVSLNLVLDALGGVPIQLEAEEPAGAARPSVPASSGFSAPSADAERKRGRSRFGGKARR